MNILLKKKIEEQLDNIIENAENLVINTNIANKEKISQSQIRNIIEIANATNSLKALKNFIRYQIGRNQLDGEFGNQFINQLENFLENITKEITRNSPKSENSVRFSLIKQYLGYLNRHYVYLTKKK